MSRLLYVYGFCPAEPAGLDQLEGVEGSVQTVRGSDLVAVYSAVDASRFSQEAIDAHANDLAWLGEIGYAHQRVVSALSEKGSLLPVRAFTLFKSTESLVAYMAEERKTLTSILGELDGKEEWTVKLEFDAQQWAASMVTRAPSLQELQREIESAPKGRAYLLQKKLGEEKKKAAREAEANVVNEIASALDPLASKMKIETRETRAGSFPQITLLMPKAGVERLQQWRDVNRPRYDAEGVKLVLSGPWPPYTFAHRSGDE